MKKNRNNHKESPRTETKYDYGVDVNPATASDFPLESFSALINHQSSKQTLFFDQLDTQSESDE